MSRDKIVSDDFVHDRNRSILNLSAGRTCQHKYKTNFPSFVPQLSIANIPPPEALFSTERVITKLKQHPPPSSEQFPKQLAESHLY